MVHEAGAECQSEAVESFLVEHTGVQIHGNILSHITTAGLPKEPKHLLSIV